MCSTELIGSDGKPANVICIREEDFDSKGVLKDLTSVDAVLFIGADWCGHCKTFKPEFVKFSELITGTNIRALYINEKNQKGLITKMRKNKESWGFDIPGFPAIIGFHNGEFYSEYGYDNPSTFRKADDVLEYAKGLGKAPIVWKEK